MITVFLVDLLVVHETNIQRTFVYVLEASLVTVNGKRILLRSCKGIELSPWSQWLLYTGQLLLLNNFIKLVLLCENMFLFNKKNHWWQFGFLFSHLHLHLVPSVHILTPTGLRRTNFVGRNSAKKLICIDHKRSINILNTETSYFTYEKKIESRQSLSFWLNESQMIEFDKKKLNIIWRKSDETSDSIAKYCSFSSQIRLKLLNSCALFNRLTYGKFHCFFEILKPLNLWMIQTK